MNTKSAGGVPQTKGTVKGLAQWVDLRPDQVLGVENKFSRFHFKADYPPCQLTLCEIAT